MSPARRATIAVLSIAACAAALVGGAVIRQARDTATGSLNLGRLSASLQPGSIMAEREYFARLLVELRSNYVEPIDDEMALALGAVRGVVTSLNDPYAAYFDAEESAIEAKRERGVYEGIGIELAVMPSEGAEPTEEMENLTPQQANLAMRDLVVTFVAPGGPADKAGLKPGAVIESVDARLVPSWKTTSELRKLRQKFDDGELTGDELMIEMEKFSERFERSLPEARARALLTGGTSGTIDVTWFEGDEIKKATIEKAQTEVSALEERDGRFLVRLIGKDSADYSRLGGLDEVSIDLRNSGLGTERALRAILPNLLESGNYGFLQEHPSKGAVAFKVEGNGRHPSQYEVYVDSTTTGFALILAKVLEASGSATIIGSAGNEALWPSRFELPGGDSMRFSTARHFVEMPRTEVASK